MWRFLATGLIPFFLSLAITAPSQAVEIRNDVTGGDCTLVGDWDMGTKTCTLTTDLNEAVFILSQGIDLDCAGYTLSGPTAPNIGVILQSGSDGAIVRNCDIQHFIVGIFASSSNDHVFVDNSVQGNLRGLLILDSANISVSGSSLRLNAFGIFTNNAHGLLFTANSVEDNSIGMHLLFSDGVSITNNSFVRNRDDRGVRIFGGMNNLVAHNRFTDNGFGITLIFGGSHQINDNLFVGNGFPKRFAPGDGPTVALAGEESNDNVLTNNVMVDNTYGFSLYGTGNTIDTSNTVDGHPIYWFNDLIGATITPALAPGAAGVYCDRCTGVTIRDFELTTPMGIGIGLYESTGSSVENNVIRDSSWGILLPLGSDDNVVRDNEISLSFEDIFAFGIRLFGADGNLIAGNRIDLGPGNSGWNGISLGRHLGVGFQDPADSNTVAGNLVKRVLQQAIEVGGSHNLIEGNTLIDTGGGIIVEGPGVDKVGNVIQGNVIRDGRDAWFPFDPYPVGFGHGISISEADDTLVTRNSVTRMRDNGLRILDSFGTAVSRNDLYGNARNGIDDEGQPIFEVTSLDSSGANPAAVELSVNGVGNYWGRNCGSGNTKGPPLFQAGLDSNSDVVVDSNPFAHPVSNVEPTEGLVALECPAELQ